MSRKNLKNALKMLQSKSFEIWDQGKLLGNEDRNGRS